MSSGPLVSCIMPTRNRRLFVGQAIAYFLRQDYPHRELLILDDGEVAIEDLVPADERIRYFRFDHHIPLGAKRNLGCEYSRGEIIAHWDDDDWIGPNRLSVQVGQLLSSGADVTGADEILHYRPATAEAWLYRHSSNEHPWLAGGTLVYRREAWAERRFPEVSIREDGAFVSGFSRDRILGLSNPPFYVAVIHSRNTTSHHLAGPEWQRIPLDAVSDRLADDRDFYVMLRNGRTSAARAQARRTVSSVTVAAPVIVYDGYGSMAEYLILGLAQAGATVNVVPIGLDLNGLSVEAQDIIKRSRPEPGAPVLYFCWPRPDLERFRQSDDLFVNTMWESSLLPAAWPSDLNRARTVIVPTEFVANVCRASGVTVPIAVIPEGIDPDVYHIEDRPDRVGLTTLIVGTVIDRKHTLEGIAAWKLAFGDDPDARLIVKSRFNYRNYEPDDPRITLVDANEPTRGIAHWYRQADVLLALGNEGFGLPLVEGMATGLPVIALNSEGQSDICRAVPDLVLSVEPVRWEPYVEEPFGSCGVRGVPGIEDVADRLCWVAANRNEARAIGRAASDWVTKNRNIWSKAPAVLDVMEGAVRPVRPLRRSDTIWVPSWETACGISEYTAHLVEQMPAVRVTTQLPDQRGIRLLHVQHEDSLFDEVTFTRQIEQVARSGIPVAITEHTVQGFSRLWEREASALVAMTARGADMLRSRWPGKRVELIPHGCPTWFPPRKSRRGRVIGAFGFLEQYKGYWKLLDVLRQVPDTELLLFSHSKWAGIDTEWEEATAGLPVKRIREFLPAAEIARRLAAEADVLVFWYDEMSHAVASGAVRIGLATGVPVLTSPTNWFADLVDVTYQPPTLLEGVEQLLEDTALRERLVLGAREYCEEHSWSRTAERHRALWRSLARA